VNQQFQDIPSYLPFLDPSLFQIFSAFCSISQPQIIIFRPTRVPWISHFLEPKSPNKYPLVICYVAIENGPVEIVDFPIKNGGSFHRFLYVYQRVSPSLYHHSSPLITINHHYHYTIITIYQRVGRNPRRWIRMPFQDPIRSALFQAPKATADGGSQQEVRLLVIPRYYELEAKNGRLLVV